MRTYLFQMTPNELKFALALESVLNCIPQPEYRQLIVEALMVLTLITEHSNIDNLGDTITVEHLVHSANRVFLQDQVLIRVNCSRIIEDYSYLPLPETT